MKTAMGKNVILRIEMNSEELSFGTLEAAIKRLGGDIIAVDLVQSGE
jgi:malate dehydrogenase (oxaloacetate-decarboxylating)